VTSVLILAAAQDDIRHRRKRWILWTIALITVIAAICLNFSRGGVIILVAASAIWIGTVALRLDAPTRAGAACRISLAVSFLLLLVSALLVAGGQTVARFHLQKLAGQRVFTSDFRWLIFRDTWQLIRSSPWVGLGLGNFESIFAIFRDASHGNTRSLHPESDWLWVWSELGLVALLLIVLGAVLLIRRVAPLQVGTNQRFRLAALIGAVMFALHGLIDVSGHRVGTAYSAMFLLGPFAASPHATAVVENNPVDVSAPRSRACRDRSFLDDCLALDGDVAWRGRGRQRQAARHCRQSRA
jgi:O-antigen ligase